MKKITLDVNCLYELESDAPAEALRALVDMARYKKLSLQIPAIAASERQRGGDRIRDFRVFHERVNRLELGDAELLRPPAYIGLSFIEWALIPGYEQQKQEERIHEIMFPNIAFKAADYCDNDNHNGRNKWRNAKCDVLALWCHIHYGGDVFVTRDRDCLKHSVRSRLEAIGAKAIATPEEALSILQPKARINEQSA